jgi:hypothetical protein
MGAHLVTGTIDTSGRGLSRPGTATDVPLKGLLRCVSQNVKPPYETSTPCVSFMEREAPLVPQALRGGYSGIRRLPDVTLSDAFMEGFMHVQLRNALAALPVGTLRRRRIFALAEEYAHRGKAAAVVPRHIAWAEQALQVLPGTCGSTPERSLPWCHLVRTTPQVVAADHRLHFSGSSLNHRPGGSAPFGMLPHHLQIHGLPDSHRR